MPTLIRLIVVLLILVGIGYGAMFALTVFVHPRDKDVTIRIPAREIILAVRPPDAISLHNVISGTVHRITAEPGRRSVLVEISLPTGTLLARVTPDAIARLGLARGSAVLALVKSTSIEVMLPSRWR